MKLNRILAGLLALVLALSLCACGKDSKKADPKKKTSKTAGTSETASASSDKKTSETDSTSDSSSVSGKSDTSAKTGGNEAFVEIVNAQAEYDIVPHEVRSYISAAQSYNTGDYTSSIISKYNIPAKPEPVRISFRYGDPASVQKAEVVVSEHADMSNPFITVQAPTPSATSKLATVAISNLKTGTTYYCQARATKKGGAVMNTKTVSFKTAAGVRMLDIAGVKNARDLGGWKTKDGKTVKQGILFRTANLDSITASGKSTVIDLLGVKTELDMRGTPGNNETPRAMLGSKVNYQNIYTWSYKKHLDMTASGDTQTRIFRLFTKLENYPILFHCVEGADRTGTVAFLLKALVGVSENDLVADYELTPNRDRTGPGGHDFPSLIETLYAQPGSNIQEKTYNFYHDTCKISAMELANVKNILLTDSAVFQSDSLSVQNISAGSSVKLGLTMRSSKSVSGVTFAGKTAAFSLSGSTLSVTVSGSGLQKGTIRFNDGATLDFEVNVQ